MARRKRQAPPFHSSHITTFAGRSTRRNVHLVIESSPAPSPTRLILHIETDQTSQSDLQGHLFKSAPYTLPFYLREAGLFSRAWHLPGIGPPAAAGRSAAQPAS